MTIKEEVLRQVKTLAEQKRITREELIAAYEEGRGVERVHRFGAGEILYYIGGAIVFLGIVILLWQNWALLTFSAKLIATLGFGMAAYYAGLLFSRDEKTKLVGYVFYVISALVLPFGFWVVFDHAGYNASGSGSQSVISSVMLVVYLLSYAVFRKNIFKLLSILFGTWLFFSITNFMGDHSLYASRSNYDEYRILTMAVTYIFFGHAFSKNEKTALSTFLYNAGVFGFLAAGLALGGWKPEQNLFWELIYPFLVFVTLFLSLRIKSKAVLTWSTLFLMAYILKITSEHFAHSLGWPFALTLAGLVIIALGYVSLLLKKKYL